MAGEPEGDPRDFDAGTLLDLLATAIIVVDAGGVVRWLNAAAGDLLATSPAAACGRRLATLLADGTQVDSLILRCRASGEPLAMRGFELVPAARSDSHHLADITFTPVADASVLLEIADTTRPSRITRDTALLAQQGGSRVMARQLAHEIKNPLGGLRGAAQLLERELPTDELKEYTRVIIGEADRLCALVDSLLGPARPIHREPVNVHELIDHVYRLARAEAPAAVAIERDYDPSLPLLALDRDLMVQAMLNLARNAVQALASRSPNDPSRDQIRITGRREGAVVVIELADTGPGLSEKARVHLFEAFQASTRAGGTGLGLAIAAELVRSHGGDIRLVDGTIGATFRITIPDRAVDLQAWRSGQARA